METDVVLTNRGIRRVIDALQIAERVTKNHLVRGLSEEKVSQIELRAQIFTDTKEKFERIQREIGERTDAEVKAYHAKGVK